MLDTPPPAQMPLRPASEVMRLRRMGAAFPTRLSFMRSLLRALSVEKAVVTRPVWNIDADGFGHAVYTVSLGGFDYALVAVSTDIPDDMRTDRVIATAWDTAAHHCGLWQWQIRYRRPRPHLRSPASWRPFCG